jgi:hypothetical protein
MNKFTHILLQKMLVFCMALFIFLVLPTFSFSAMQSANYQLQADSINIGGLRGSSASYTLESTVGEVGTGESSSTNYALKAGYQQMVASTISLAVSSSSVTFLAETALIYTASTTLTVTTDNIAGYTLSVKSSASPTLSSSEDTILDYTPAGGNPDFAFSVASNEAVFGFSPEGSDIVQKYQDNGVACNTGSSDSAQKCWEGFSTSNEQIAQSTAPNNPTGTATVLEMRSQIGADRYLQTGTFTGALTVTVAAL